MISYFVYAFIGFITFTFFFSKKRITPDYVEPMKLLESKSPLLVEDEKPDATPEYDVIIIGAGVAGGALGSVLGARNIGKKVLVIERDLTEPDRIVGELLQPAGVERLKELGLLHCIEGKDFDAQIVKGYGLLYNKEWAHLSYPTIDQLDSRAEGRSFHNGRLLTRFRENIRKYDNVSLIQGTVTKMTVNCQNGRINGVMYKDDKNQIQTARASLVVVCDGFNSSFRRPFNQSNVDIKSKFVGLVLKNCKLPFPNHGHVILANPTPILVYPISSTEARMLIDFPDEIPTDPQLLAQHMKEFVLPQLPQEIHQAFLAEVEQQNYKMMPNRSMTAKPMFVPGVLLLGDSLNMRHPLTGGGMTVLLTDVRNIVNLIDEYKLKDFSDYATLDKILYQHYCLRNPPVAVINILADALYDVCGEKYPELREACFSYLKLGGFFADGPIRFLSGISHSQIFLLIHFFAVAFFGLGRILLPFPTPDRINKAIKTLRAAVSIIIPVLAKNNSSIMVKMFCSLVRTVFWV